MIKKEFKIIFIKNFISEYEAGVFDALIGSDFWATMIGIYVKFQGIESSEESVEVELNLLSKESVPTNMNRVQTQMILFLLKEV